MSFGWLDNSSKSDLTVQRVFIWRCLNEGMGSKGAKGLRGGQGWTGHFQKSPYSLSHFVISDSLL